MSQKSVETRNWVTPASNLRRGLALFGLAALMGLGGTAAASCFSKVYTTAADFNAGIRFNTIGVNDATNGRLQLVDQGSLQTFPTLWPANAGEDTVSKFDTNLNKEIGRYRTWFDGGFHGAFSGPAPSRTAVDSSGNVYIANRHFDGNVISVMKILTSNAGATDRNGNGVIDTSVDTNNNGVVTGAELLPILDDGGASAGAAGGVAGDGIPQIQEFHDERVKWFIRIPGTAGALGRSLAIDPSGNIWVGSYSPGAYYKLDGNTGAVLAGPIAATSMTPYGAVIESNGMLWSAGLSNALGQLNTLTNTWVTTRFADRNNYGIALDGARKRVYLGNGSPYTTFATDTLTFSYPSAATDGLGISVANNGDILVHGSNSGFPNFVNGSASGYYYGMTRFRPDNSVVWSSASQAGAVDGGTRGIAPDSNGDIFTINLDTANVSKYRGTDGAHLGVFPIGYQPYSYSDLSGTSFAQTNPSGTWTAETSDTLRGNKNIVATWTAVGPGTVKVEVAASNTSGAPGPFVLATSGSVIPGIAGKYLTVRVTLQASNQQTPGLLDLTLSSSPQIGDFNNDGCVDTDDYNIIRAAYQARTTNLIYDMNGDGVVNVADLRTEVLLFCRPNGASCVQSL